MDADLKSFISKHLDLLDRDRNSSSFEMEERAAKFLRAVAILAEAKLDLEDTIIEVSSLERAKANETMINATGKTVTEKKLSAESNTDYRTIRENLEKLEAELGYVKSIMDVFNNSHILYRQMSREK